MEEKVIKKGLNTIKGISSEYLYVWFDYDHEKIKVYSEGGVKYISLSFDRDRATTASAEKFNDWIDRAQLEDATPDEIKSLGL